YRQITARELVLPLRAGLDRGQAMGNRIVDGLVIAKLEMQGAMVLDASPIAAVNGVGSKEVQGAGNAAAAAPRHDQQNILGHGFADQGEEAAVQIGAPPFAAARIHVELEK